MTQTPFPPQAGMAQCQVTGKWVPEDELVTIHGQRVCAEGKVQLLERLRSGENLPGELEAPSILRRFGAMFLDGLIVYAVATLPAIALGVIVATQRNDLMWMQYAMSLFISVLVFLYYVLMHAYNGQTLGKMAVKIRVVLPDGGKISFAVSVRRALFYMGPSILSQIFAFTGMPQVVLAVSVLVFVYWFIDVVLALTDRDQQRSLHDRLGGTRVIALD